MSDEWWVMSDKNWLTKKMIPNSPLISLYKWYRYKQNLEGTGDQELIVKRSSCPYTKVIYYYTEIYGQHDYSPTKVNKPQAQVPFHVHHQAQPTHKIHEMRLGDYTLTLLWSPLNHLCCLGPFKSKTIYWLMVPVDH